MKLVEYMGLLNDEFIIAGWTLLAILEKLHCRDMGELKFEVTGYRDIRNYFVKLTGSVEEAAPEALPPGKTSKRLGWLNN